MTDQAQASEPTFRLVYRSRSRIPSDDRSVALADIFSEARANNKRAGITGALLVTDHWFVQALEGDESAVRGLYERIAKDARHDEVTVLETTAAARVFGRWAMAQVSSVGHADIPLHALDGHIHTAAEVPVTREQSAVLKSMRDTIGADTV